MDARDSGFGIRRAESTPSGGGRFHVEPARGSACGCSTWNVRWLGWDANPESRFLEHLPEHHEPAAQALDERPSGFVHERRGDKRRGVRAGGCSEQEDPASQPQEGLDAGQELLLQAHGPDTDQVL